MNKKSYFKRGEQKPQKPKQNFGRLKTTIKITIGNLRLGQNSSPKFNANLAGVNPG